MLLERTKDRKMLVISRVLLDAHDILKNIDVIVRFKQNTAEMLNTKLYDMDSFRRL